eukprot:584218-Amphidinium_carterae.2
MHPQQALDEDVRIGVLSKFAPEKRHTDNSNPPRSSETTPVDLSVLQQQQQQQQQQGWWVASLDTSPTTVGATTRALKAGRRNCACCSEVAENPSSNYPP